VFEVDLCDLWLLELVEYLHKVLGLGSLLGPGIEVGVEGYLPFLVFLLPFLLLLFPLHLLHFLLFSLRCLHFILVLHLLVALQRVHLEQFPNVFFQGLDFL